MKTFNMQYLSGIWMINSQDISYPLYMIKFDKVIDISQGSFHLDQTSMLSIRYSMTNKREKGWEKYSTSKI